MGWGRGSGAETPHAVCAGSVCSPLHWAANMAASSWLRAVLLFLCASDLLLLSPPEAYATDTPGEAITPPRKKKDIRDYNDADMARLLEQWEVRVARILLSIFPYRSLFSNPYPLGLLTF